MQVIYSMNELFQIKSALLNYFLRDLDGLSGDVAHTLRQITNTKQHHVNNNNILNKHMLTQSDNIKCTFSD